MPALPSYFFSGSNSLSSWLIYPISSSLGSCILSCQIWVCIRSLIAIFLYVSFISISLFLYPVALSLSLRSYLQSSLGSVLGSLALGSCIQNNNLSVPVSNTLISWLLYPEPYLFPVHSFLGSCIQVPHLLVPVPNIHIHKSFVSVSNTLIS